MNIKFFEIYDLGDTPNIPAEEGVKIVDIKKETTIRELIKFINSFEIIELYAFSKVVFEKEGRKNEMFTEEFLKEFSVDKDSLKPFIDYEKGYEIYYEGDMSNILETLQECIEGFDMQGMYEIFEEEWHECCNYTTDDEIEKIKRKVTFELNEEEEEWVRDQVEENINNSVIDEAAKNTSYIPVRIMLNSNHDCTNSFWFETNGRGVGVEENYLGDVLKFTGINPQEFKKAVLDEGYETHGKFQKRKDKGFFFAKDLMAEYEELSSPVSLFTMIGYMSASEIIKLILKPKGERKITIPKGTNYGFYSSSHGGGSIFDAETKEELVLDLEWNGKTGYDSLSLKIDSVDGYSLKDCYGVCESFFKKEFKVKEH